MATPPAQSDQRLVSLRRRFLWLLTGVVGLFAMGMTLSLVFGLRSSEVADERLLNAESAQTKASVMRLWDYYRELVNNLALDPALIDQMLVGTTADKQEWAASRQRLVPNILGLALVSPEGEIYGDPGLLRVGPSCQRDLRVQDMRVPARSPIHRDMPGLEHVDLIALVHGPGGEVLGKVFVSLRLAQLQRVIEDSTLPGHTIALLDAKGQPVVSSGTLRGGMREISVPLPEIGWRLVVQSPIDRFGHNGELHILAGLFTLAGVLVLLVMAVMQLRRPLQQETHDALEALACLTRNESAPPIVTRYEEFAPVAAGINSIAQRLHDQREQLAKLSLTDPLTELPNRRAFETRFPLAQGQAERRHPVALVLLDIDHFKRVNDRYGHGVGDQVLLALARSMTALTRRADLAARLAGDEFVALLADLDASGVDRWYQRLSEHFRSELDAFGLDIQASLSAGQTWLGGASSDTVSDALARADRALYQAKAQGRAQLVPAVAPAGAATE